jgi:hypothetical protein
VSINDLVKEDDDAREMRQVTNDVRSVIQDYLPEIRQSILRAVTSL